MHQKLIAELQALRIYLASIGAVYPIAPERAIATVDAAEHALIETAYQLRTACNILEMIQIASTDADARAAAKSAVDALKATVQP